MNELLVQLQMKMEGIPKRMQPFKQKKETRQPANVPAVSHLKWNRC